MIRMRSLLPFVSVILALIAAGSIAYIAWELSSGEPGSDAPVQPDPPDDDNSEARG
jgi:hypothetical protein